MEHNHQRRLCHEPNPENALTVYRHPPPGRLRRERVHNRSGLIGRSEAGYHHPTGPDGKFALSLTAGQVTALKAASATAKIVSVGGTDTTTTLEVGLLASDLPAITGD